MASDYALSWPTPHPIGSVKSPHGLPGCCKSLGVQLRPDNLVLVSRHIGKKRFGTHTRKQKWNKRYPPADKMAVRSGRQPISGYFFDIKGLLDNALPNSLFTLRKTIISTSTPFSNQSWYVLFTRTRSLSLREIEDAALAR